MDDHTEELDFVDYARHQTLDSGLDCAFQVPIFGRIGMATREGHAASDSGLEPLASNTVVLAGHSSEAQSYPSGVDRVLCAIRSLGTVSPTAARPWPADGETGKLGSCGL